MTEISIGLIVNKNNEYLISLRKEILHQGGKWEFPGGKVELNETAQQALYRELKEEVSLNIEESQLFERFVFDYEDKTLILNFYLVNKFTGEAKSKIGQTIKWVTGQELLNYDFPKANKTVIEKMLNKQKKL